MRDEVFTLKMEAARSSEMFVSHHITTWHHNPGACDLTALVFKESDTVGP